MTYTYDAIIAELDYRREQLLADASQFRLARRLRRRKARTTTTESGGEPLATPTGLRDYDLAA